MTPAAPRGRGRERLDLLLVQRGLAASRSQAQALVLAGRVCSGGQRLDKPGHQFAADVPLEVLPGRRYVSRGGHKLSGALVEFGIPVAGRDALDIGASTGGFVQVLLEADVRRVIALDVGRGQLDWALRNDPRVHPLEGVNARYLRPETLPFSPALCTVDVSFISLERILPPAVDCLTREGEVLALVKPQFEVGRGRVGRGGIVRDAALHREVLERLAGFVAASGWGIQRPRPSRLPGADGNREFFIHVTPNRPGLNDDDLAETIEQAVMSGEESDA